MKKERKKERKTFNHQCSFLPTSRTLPFHPYLIPLRARVTRTKASPRVHPPLVLFSSLPFLGGKSRQKKRHEDAPTPSSSRRRRPRDVVREGSADDDDDRVARVSRHGAAFRAVREPGTACGTHLFFFASRFGCVSLSLSSTIITFCISSSKVAIDEIARGKSRRRVRLERVGDRGGGGGF